MKIIDCVQGSPEWHAARAGKVTASRMSDVLSRARDRKSEGTTRRRYKAQIIAEILTGLCQEDGFTSRPIEEGLENEPFARAAYEVAMGVEVEQVGFVLHPTIPRSGCSPDGLVGTDGMVQIKCPLAHTHIYWLLGDDVPAEHEPQMHSELDCCERSWSDFVSYCPVLPAPLNLFVKRLQRDPKRVAELRAEVSGFLKEVDVALAALGVNGYDLETVLRKSLMAAAA